MAMKRVRNSAGKRKHSGADSDSTTKICRTQANPSCDNEPIESLEVDPAESLASEIKAGRFKVAAVETKIEVVEVKIKAVEIKIKVVESKIDTVEICLAGDSEEIHNSTNVDVLRYKLSKEGQLREEKKQLREEKKQLREEKKQLREEKNKVLDEKNKLLDLVLEEKKNPRGSGGKASCLAFLVRLLFLNLVPC